MKVWAVPRPPAWRVDWATLLRQFPIVSALENVAQSPRYHSEGDVLTHTRLVCEMLAVSSKWRGFSEKERSIVFAAALLHDIGKLRAVPSESEHTLSSRHHARVGARLARRFLYEQGVPFRIREAIVNLVRYHQAPFWVFEKENPAALVLRISQNIRCDWLCALALADAKGRISDEKASLVEAALLFTEMATALDCLETPAEFRSAHGRYLFFRDRWHVPDFAPEEAFKGRIVILSGLPGVGKGEWRRRCCPELPVVESCGDADRGALGGAAPETMTRDRIGALIGDRLAEGASFVFGGDNISRKVRHRVAAFAADQGARVEMVYVERPLKRLIKGYRGNIRIARRNELTRILEHLFDVPDPWDADALRYVIE